MTFSVAGTIISGAKSLRFFFLVFCSFSTSFRLKYKRRSFVVEAMLKRNFTSCHKTKLKHSMRHSYRTLLRRVLPQEHVERSYAEFSLKNTWNAPTQNSPSRTRGTLLRRVLPQEHVERSYAEFSLKNTWNAPTQSSPSRTRGTLLRRVLPQERGTLLRRILPQEHVERSYAEFSFKNTWNAPTQSSPSTTRGTRVGSQCIATTE